MSVSASSSLVLRRLYRSLLKVAKPFDDFQSPTSSALCCLIHRTGIEDENSWDELLREHIGDKDDFPSPNDQSPPHHRLFRKLLREFVSGSGTLGIRQMMFPSHRNPSSTPRLVDLIRREFKCPVVESEEPASPKDGDSLSQGHTLETRKEVAFLALRELSKKLAWSETLAAEAPTPHRNQAARWVAPLPIQASEYLQPGAFLIAHPLMSGYFRRSVICILDHQEEDSTTSLYGTYGLVVNRVCVGTSGRNLSMAEILHPIPSSLERAFSGFMVKEGGPVHMSLQMLHGETPVAEESEQIGGTLLPMIVPNGETSTALHTGSAVYYKGDILKAAEAVLAGQIDQEDVSFFVGASCWSLGQLESEIERGFWLPCRGPPEIALHGMCVHEPTGSNDDRPKADLWLSMLSACGEGEMQLAHLTWKDNGLDDQCSYPCDEL